MKKCDAIGGHTHPNKIQVGFSIQPRHFKYTCEVSTEEFKLLKIEERLYNVEEEQRLIVASLDSIMDVLPKKETPGREDKGGGTGYGGMGAQVYSNAGSRRCNGDLGNAGSPYSTVTKRETPEETIIRLLK